MSTHSDGSDAGPEQAKNAGSRGRLKDPEAARAAARARWDARLELPEERGASHVDDVLAGYEQIERRLVAKDFPPTSPFWRGTFERWYRSGRRQLVARVGRRGGKSSSFSRLAVAEALFGHHDVPPGDIGFVGIVSTDRSEATGRLRTIKAILDALGVDYAPVEGTPNAIRIEGRRIGFRVFTASISGVSGFTGIFIFADEVAKWKDDDTGANPADEVLRSVRPTLRTMPHARIALSSSPMGMYDAHYDAYERGEDARQITAYAPSWVANPTLSEDGTRADATDDLEWEREDKAIPQAAGESSLVPELLVDRSTRRPPQLWDLPPEPGHRYVAYIDPATRGNAWTMVLLTRGVDRVRRVALVREWQGSPRAPLSPGAVFAEISALLAPYGVRSIRSDQWSQDALAEIARGYGLSLLCDEPWSPTAKREAYEALRSALQQGTLELHPDPQVKADVLAIRKKLTRTGVTYELVEQNGRHADYAPPLAMAAVEALAPARDLEPETDEAYAARHKREFLLGREKERKRAEKQGRLPATHRRLRG